MVRRFCNVMGLVLWGVFLSAQVMADPMVNLVLVDAPSNVGDTFEVEVWADGDNIGLELLSFGFDVLFSNGSVFNYDGYTLESGFEDFSSGAGNVTGDVFPGIPENEVLLATLSFSTLALGTDTLSVIGPYDQHFGGLYYERPDWSIDGFDINATLTISVGVTPVPEPAAIFLISTGLLGWAGFKRKF